MHWAHTPPMAFWVAAQRWGKDRITEELVLKDALLQGTIHGRPHENDYNYKVITSTKWLSSHFKAWRKGYFLDIHLLSTQPAVHVLHQRYQSLLALLVRWGVQGKSMGQVRHRDPSLPPTSLIQHRWHPNRPVQNTSPSRRCSPELAPVSPMDGTAWDQPHHALKLMHIPATVSWGWSDAEKGQHQGSDYGVLQGGWGPWAGCLTPLVYIIIFMGLR